MNKLLSESIIIGTITSILGSVILRILLTNFNDIEQNESLDHILNKYKKSYIIEITLFLTGIMMHLILEYIGLDKWYCEKKCVADKCKMVCTKKL